MQKFIVSRDDNTYEAWPDLVLTDSGKLICVFTECKHHLTREDVRLVICESLDRGRTWSAKKPLTDKVNGECSWNCARISRLNDGRLAIVCDWHKEHKTGILNIWYSDNDGESWDGPYETPGRGVVPHKLLQLPNGRLLLSAHRRDPENNRHSVVYCRYSDDNGKTWSEESVVGDIPGYYLCEESILPLKSGELVAFMRENSHMGRDCYKSISRDNGETWEGPYPMAICGCHRPVATPLQSGRILITFRYVPGFGPWGNWMHNFMGCFTDEESCLETERRKQKVRIFPIDYDRSERADLGYSGVVQFPDGEIYMVTYIMDDSVNSQIRGYSMREEEFFLP